MNSFKSVYKCVAFGLLIIVLAACGKKEDSETKRVASGGGGGAVGAQTPAIMAQAEQQKSLVYIADVLATDINGQGGRDVTSIVKSMQGGTANIITNHNDSGSSVGSGSFDLDGKNIAFEGVCGNSEDTVCAYYVISLIVRINNQVQYQYGLKVDLVQSNTGNYYMYNPASGILSLQQLVNEFLKL